jgi:polysaccharide pyruvyl transferase WcaK-like protein
VIIDIRGTNTTNKGAQLMLEAICSRLGDTYEFSVSPTTTDAAVRRRLGLHLVLRYPLAPKLTATAGELVPARVRARQRLVTDAEIGGVLDASGFHYTDQLPTAFARSEALAGRSWLRRGVPKVLLPQAFGPFEKSGTRRWSREALAQANLVFVRDRVSEKYVRALDVDTPIVRSPDFTIGMKPATVEPVCDQPFLALVPNKKLFTHGRLKREEYLQILSRFGEAAKANGLASVVVEHEETDHPTARELADRIGAPLFRDPDPLVLKGVLGQATAAVASRFHAVVGCVSQSVPTLALGWSHKYHELLDDFGVPERLVNPDTDPAAAITNLLADEAGNARQKAQLPVLLEKVDAMWERTVDTLAGA